ncbi:hypothetical protein P7K49_005896, partial [Saguinus oedipus]
PRGAGGTCDDERGGDITVASSSGAPTPPSVRALGRARPEGNRGSPQGAPSGDASSTDFNSRRALRAEA